MNHQHRLLVLTVAAAGAMAASALGGALLALAATSTGYQLLVADGASGTVFVIDAGATTATAIPAPVAGGVQSLAVSPDGSRVYVAFKDGVLGTIDTSSDSYVGNPLNLGSTSIPSEMVVTPSGKDLYVAEAGLGQVAEVDTSTDSVVGAPIASAAALNLAITPDGASLFVDGGSQSSSVTVITTASNTVSGTAIPVASPGALLVSPDGSHLYVLTSTSSGPGLAVIDTATNAPVGPTIALPVQSRPESLALNPGGTQLYLTDGTGQELISIDTAAGTVGTSPVVLPGGLSPRDVAVTADGSTGFVDGTTAAGAAEVVAVDLASGSASTPLSLTGATQPAGLVIAPLAPVATPTPTPTPTTPTTTCSTGPIMIGPVPVTVPPVEVGPPIAPSGVSSTGSGSKSIPPAAASSPSTALPPTGPLPPVPASLPPWPGLPGSGPPLIICHGPLMAGPLEGAASLARGSAGPSSGSLYLPAALAVLALAAGGAAMVAKQRGLRLPGLRRWRNG